MLRSEAKRLISYHQTVTAKTDNQITRRPAGSFVFFEKWRLLSPPQP
jgi:hypothetical protein